MFYDGENVADITLKSSGCYYFKIDKLVFIWGNPYFSCHSGGTKVAAIGGLPFKMVAGPNYAVPMGPSSALSDSSNGIVGSVNTSNAIIVLYSYSFSGLHWVKKDDSIRFEFFYLTE